MSRTASLPMAAGLILAALLLAPASAQVNRQAIEDVAAGKIKEARASWWGFNPEDSTQALQAAINSGAPKLVVENTGKPWIVECITLAGNQEILFEKGVEVLAKKGAFKGTGDCLFRAERKENITLTGYGATLRMRKADYQSPEYQKAEWRHCLSFRSCKNIKVYGLALAESGGDGIYLGMAKKGVTNKDVHIKDVVCDKNHRQGISVITAEDLLIEDTLLRDTSGTAPQAGIDFEPNHPGERLVNCVMRNCVASGNAGGGYDFYLPPLDATSEPISLRIENCRSENDRPSAVRICTGNTPARAVKGKIEFVNCTFQGSGGAGISIADKPVDGCRIRFEKCSLLDTALTATTQAPIVFQARQGASESVGGVEFAECVVRDPQDRKPMASVDGAGGVGIKGITGNLVLEKDGRRTEVLLTENLLAEWMPEPRIKKIARFPMKGVAFQPVSENAPATAYALPFARLRRTARFVLYAKGGDPVSFRVRYRPVGRYTGTTVPVVVKGPAGAEVKRAEAVFNEESEVAFTAPETGLYRITADPGRNHVLVSGTSHLMNVAGEEDAINLYISPGEYYFWVPAGTKEFGIRVFGEGIGEAVKAALQDPAGKVVEEVDNAAQTHQFEVTLPAPSKGEAWCLRLARPSKAAMEDHFVDLRGVPPFLAPTKEALLRPVP